MAWSVPRTWVAGEIVTAAIQNSAVRDNLRFLKGLDGDTQLSDDLDMVGTAHAVRVNRVASADRPTGQTGEIVYLTTRNQFESFANGAWVSTPMVLLTTSGLFTGTATGTLAAITITGLGTNDAIAGHYYLFQTGTAGGQVLLRAGTALLVAVGVAAGTLAVSDQVVGRLLVVPAQNGSGTQSYGWDHGGIGTSLRTRVDVTNWAESSWTGTFSLNVTAQPNQSTAGTLLWRLTIYRIPGIA